MIIPDLHSNLLTEYDMNLNTFSELCFDLQFLELRISVQLRGMLRLTEKRKVIFQIETKAHKL